MTEVLCCAPDTLRALRNSSTGRKVVFFTGPDLDAAAKADPAVRTLRDIVDELLDAGVAVHWCRPAPDPHPRDFCEHVLIRKSPGP